MRRKIGPLVIFLLMSAIALTTLGAGPGQQGGNVPPQPFYADYFSGRVFLKSAPAGEGVQIVACVDDCSVFQSEPQTLGPDGQYNLLAVDPENRRLKGRTISFYIVNQYGRIKAAEVRVFEGAYNISTLDLHFSDPLPMPPAPPALPRVGDPFLPYLPKLLLAGGATAVAAGVLLTLRARRQEAS